MKFTTWGGNVYTAGPAVVTVYVVTLAYIVSSLACAVYIRRNHNSRRGQAVVITMTLWLAAAAVQMMNNEFLVVGFASAVGVMILYIVLDNPDANLDRQLGCFNSFALHQYLEQQGKGTEAFHIMDVSLRDLRTLEERGIDVQARTKEFIKATDPETVREAGQDGEPYLIDFRAAPDGREQWYQMKAARLSVHDGHACAIIGIRNNDAVMRKALLEQQNREAVENITSTIADDYECMFHVDFDTLKEDHYRRSETFFRAIPQWSAETDYRNRVEMLGNGLVHPEDRAYFFEAMEPEVASEKVKNGTPYYIEFRVLLDGEVHWYQIKMIHHKAHGNRNCAVVGITNIDERMAQEARSEEVLKQNLSIIGGLASSYSSVVYLDLADGTFTNYVTEKGRGTSYEKYARGYGSFDEAFFDYAREMIYENERDSIVEIARTRNLRSRLQREPEFTHTYRTVDNGKTAFCQMRVSLVEEADGLPMAAAVGFSYNDDEVVLNYIDEKLRAEYMSIYLVDLENDEYRMNRVAMVLDGFEKNERGVFTRIISQYAKLISPKYRDVWERFSDLNFLRGYLSRDDRRELVYTVEGDNRPWRRAILQVVERKEGVPTLFIFTVQQIDDERAERLTLLETIETQQKALEEALSMAQSANRAKTTFLNNMSHDIRTPMNAIIGYTGLAASHIDSREMVTEYLKKIGQSSEHLLSLINDILDMSRIESGKMTLNEKEEPLSEIIHTIRNITQSSISAKNLDFYVDALDVQNEFIVCDKLRLNQVLLNVLSNAIKYTPTGGTVSFKVSEHPTRAEGASVYRFTVKDSGIGMSQEFIKTIFEPFTRVKSSTVSGIQGTGLGMAITKNIVDMMGGTIDVRSEENVGTEVTVEFTFRHADTQRAAETSAALEKLNGLRGLVVDDDLDSCVSISRMLRDISMRSEWCTSGKEAVFRAQEAHEEADDFSVYIIDWMMPDVNGIETARRIRRVVGDFIPIIIVTAYDWADIEQEAYEAGVTAFANKPLFMSDLKKTLARCCEAEREAPDEEEEKPDYSGRKILLVEDNEMNREIACEILQEYGFVIDTAEDGTFAVEKMAHAVPGQYDVILMDIQMPLMDGCEATRRIRAMEDPDIANIPILAMTANAFEEDRQLALQAGMNEHIPKPIDVPKLMATLSEILS